MSNELKIDRIVSDKSGSECDYYVVDKLPSGFRSYKGITEVKVRGLFFKETRALSKFVGESHPSYSQLASIYSDVIKGVDIMDLEVVDFIVLTILSSIWTMDSFGWNPNYPCIHLKEGTEERCSGIITDLIVLDDFDFEDPVMKILPVPLNVDSKTVDIGALTLRDVIAKERYKEEHDDVDQNALDYAAIIKSIDGNTELTLEERINFVDYSPTRDLYNITAIDRDVHIKLNPVEKKCPVCGKITRIKVNLQSLKGYP